MIFFFFTDFRIFLPFMTDFGLLGFCMYILKIFSLNFFLEFFGFNIFLWIHLKVTKGSEVNHFNILIFYILRF